MKFLPTAFTALLFLLVSCREEQATVGPAPSRDLLEMEARMARLEAAILREKAARLEQQSKQDRFLREIKGMIDEQGKALAELGEIAAKEKMEPGEPIEKVGIPAVREKDDEPVDDEDEASKAEDEPDQNDLAAHRKMRLEAEGETYPYLKTIPGEEFHDLVITQINDIGVVFRHRAGVARIPFTELPAVWGERFGFDPRRAVRAYAREQAFRDQRNRALVEEEKRRQDEAESQSVDARLAQLAGAVENLRRQPQPANEHIRIGGQIFGNSLFATNPFGIWNGFVCPPVWNLPACNLPVIHPPVIRNQGNRVGSYRTLRNSNHLGRRSTSGQVPRVDGSVVRSPSGNRISKPPRPVSVPTVQPPSSRGGGGGRVTRQPRVVRSSPSPRVIRPTGSFRSSTSTSRSSSRTRTKASPRVIRPTGRSHSRTRTIRPSSSARSGGRSAPRVIRRTR